MGFGKGPEQQKTVEIPKPPVTTNDNTQAAALLDPASGMGGGQKTFDEDEEKKKERKVLSLKKGIRGLRIPSPSEKVTTNASTGTPSSTGVNL